MCAIRERGNSSFQILWKLAQRLARLVALAPSAYECRQRYKVFAQLWDTTGDVGAAGTSATDSAKTGLIHLAEAMVFNLRATSEMIVEATALAVVTVMAGAVVIASAEAEIVAAATAAGAVVLAAAEAAEAAALTACPLRS